MGFGNGDLGIWRYFCARRNEASKDIAESPARSERPKERQQSTDYGQQTETPSRRDTETPSKNYALPSTGSGTSLLLTAHGSLLISLFFRTKFYKIGTKKNISFFNFILLQRNLKSVKNERKNRKESC